MLVNPKRRVILWTPFKCYSTSMMVYFQQDADWRPEIGLFRGPKPIPKSNAHSNVIPEEFADYEKWLPVRDPFKRVVSQWKYFTRNTAVDFKSWFANDARHDMLGPVTELYEHDRIIDLSKVVDEFAALGCQFQQPFPKRNIGRAQHSLTQSEKNVMRLLHESDFAALEKHK